MKRHYKIFLLSLVFASFIISFFSIGNAEFILGGDEFSLEKKIYAPNEFISGYINISLVEEPSDNVIKTNLNEQNISLLDFLNFSGLDIDKNFYCNPKNCEGTYEAVDSGSLSRDFIAGSRLIGSIITGEDIELQPDALEFSITGSGVKEYCVESPLQIDLLADGSVDWQYAEVSDEFCGALLPSQCYDDEMADQSLDITQDSYCEQISLPVSGRFRLASLVKKNKGGGDLVMFIYNKESGYAAECDLSEPNTTVSWIEESCIVNFSFSEYLDSKDYYVCIKDNVANNAYSIKAELSEPLCGYAGLPDWVDEASADFALLVQPTSISVFDRTVIFNESEFSKTHLVSMQDYLAEYIGEKYKSDCSEGCIIPISIKSKEDISIDDFSLSYCIGGLCKTEKKILSLEKKSALISMNFTKLDLGKTNFSAPGEYGNYTFDLFLGTKKIGSEYISVAMVPVITKLIAAPLEAAAPIEFFVEAYSPKNNSLVKYQWNFGDGTAQTTYSNETIHTYEEMGLFDVMVEVTDSEGLTGSRTFNLQIGSPKKILNTTIAKKKAFLQNISDEVESMTWYKNLVIKKLNIYDLESQLDEYQKKFEIAGSDEEYVDLMNQVKAIVVPKRVYDSELIQESPIIVDVDDIRPEYLEQLGAGVYQVEYDSEYRNAIWDWQWNNVDIRAGGRAISVAYDDGSIDDLVTIINLRLKSKKDTPLEEVYFVLLVNYNQMSLASDYDQREIIDAPGFVFMDMDEQKISIALQGKKNINELVFFSSPSFHELNIVPETIVCNNNGKCEEGEDWKNCREDCKPIGLAIFYIVLIVLIMFAIYLFLQKWYKKNYEKYLFKNPQDIYNLISFTKNSLKKGLGDKEIRDKLKEAGWSGEQIDYVLKKIRGKSTGLPKISAGKPAFFKNIKLKGKAEDTAKNNKLRIL